MSGLHTALSIGGLSKDNARAFYIPFGLRPLEPILLVWILGSPATFNCDRTQRFVLIISMGVLVMGVYYYSLTFFVSSPLLGSPWLSYLDIIVKVTVLSNTQHGIS